MIFTLYKSVKDFAVDVHDFLKKYEIQNNLFFHNINGGLAREDNSGMTMASVRDDSRHILLTAVRTAPHPMLIFETDNIRNDEALKFFADSLYEAGITVDLFMAEKELAKSFGDMYGSLINKRFDNNQNLVLYILEKVGSLTLPEGNFRNAADDDMYFLPYWFADFIPACKLGEWSLENGIQTAKNAIPGGRTYIWEDDFPVSLAASIRRTSDCAFIGQVYTPPHFRGKGYSTACVSSLSQTLFDEGWKYCALYADCANPYSNKVYRNIGYKEIFYYDQYKIST